MIQHETVQNFFTDLGLDANHASPSLQALAGIDSRFLRDMKLNVSSVLNGANINKKDASLLALSVAINEKNAALIDACHKRARPIVMTTIAMTAGMLPIALGWGSDPSFRAPMSIAVIGGLMTSTLLSLLVIPAVFTYVDDLETWLGKVRTRLQKA